MTGRLVALLVLPIFAGIVARESEQPFVRNPQSAQATGTPAVWFVDATAGTVLRQATPAARLFDLIPRERGRFQ